MTRAPVSERELLGRASAIAGLTLAELARLGGSPFPVDARRAKGWAGELMEVLLGASAGPRSAPDFELIGVELKTIPVSARGRPRESTYVCTVPLADGAGLGWRQSAVYRKLRRVLWVPLEAEPRIPLAERRVGSPLLWSPTPEEEAALRADWEELMEMVALGRIDEVSAHHGSVLQIRPKAAHSRVRRWATGASGARMLTLPRGFYLRSTFTGSILRRHYALAG